MVIPAFQAAGRVGAVVSTLVHFPLSSTDDPTLTILVVDDGSTDGTAEEAQAAGAIVVRHERNRGKGAALQTGLLWAARHDFESIVTADADGQHPTAEIRRLVHLPIEHRAIVLGVRNLARDGAPSANQFSNGISNRFLSWFTGLNLRDTQCGLRRYPVGETLALGCKDTGYAFESEVLLRAARRGLGIEQLPIAVIYPPAEERLSHFHVFRDPCRIISRVVKTLIEMI
ncbi:MAG: glycosyltransferase family 2 protein [Polyangiaceae bacterium]